MTLEQYRQRQKIVQSFVLNETQPKISTLSLFAEAGIEIDFEDIAGPYLDDLDSRQDPDFVISKKLLCD